MTITLHETVRVFKSSTAEKLRPQDNLLTLNSVNKYEINYILFTLIWQYHTHDTHQIYLFI